MKQEKFFSITLKISLLAIFTVLSLYSQAQIDEYTSNSETDNEVLLEKWMTDKNYFKSDLDLLAIDEPFSLEAWMLANDYWSKNFNPLFFHLDESQFELENWMARQEEWKKTMENLKLLNLDNEIQIESWMISENYWKSNYSLFFEIETTENQLEIEAWMLSKNYWGNFQNDWFLQEPEGKVEKWMYANDYWSDNYVPCPDIFDAEMPIEKWMFENNYWTNKCILKTLTRDLNEQADKVENWMYNKNYFLVQ